MKPRHQPIAQQRSGRHARGLDRSSGIDFEIAPQTTATRTAKETSITDLKNIELQENAHGQFLVFKTSDGDTFAMNLDCQEEFGFEAKMMLQKWAEEQR